MSEQKRKLEELGNGNKSHWLQQANHFIENEGWLQYSSSVALRIMAAIEEKDGMNQRKLAEAIGVKVQYISKVLKGQQNLSLKTIHKISEALGVDLITFPGFKYSQPLNNHLAKVVPFKNIANSTNKPFQAKSFSI